MKQWLLNIILKVLRWLIRRKGDQLLSDHLYDAGWIIEVQNERAFFIEPNIKGRDKIWISFENHYYRIYHGENRTFIDLQCTLQWLQVYLFLTDPYQMVETRKRIIRKDPINKQDYENNNSNKKRSRG